MYDNSYKNLMDCRVLFVLVLIFFSCLSVHAGEINPSVESQPFFCRYSLTDWTPLCVQGGTGKGSTSINAENNTFYYNSTSNETYIFSNETSLFNITIGNNLTTISNYTYFTLVNVTYSEMNQTPGPQGPQGVNGTPGIDGYTPVFGVDYFNGSDGAPGPQGEKGDKGDKGDRGDIGPQGPTGADGAANMTAGPQGPQGEQGIQGEKGDKGDKGDTGDTGPMNMTANMTAGPQGIPGPNTWDDSWNATYFLRDGSRTFTGNADIGGFKILNNTPIAFHANNGTIKQGSITASTYIKVKLTNEVFDTAEYYNAANSSFEPAVPGYYMLRANTKVSMSAANRAMNLHIYKNGESIATSLTTAYTAGSVLVSISTIAYFDGVDDFAEAYVYHTDTTRTISGEPASCYFEGYKL